MFMRAHRIAIGVFVLGLATILGAWAFQIFGGFVPCQLCLEQRIPYYIGLPLVLVSIISGMVGAPAWLTRGALLLAGLVFVWGVYLSGFHTGVEYGWWLGPADCGAGALPTGTGNLLEDLNNIRIVSCSEASWRFPDGWGLSFAGWNLVVSVILAAGALCGASRKAA